MTSLKEKLDLYFNTLEELRHGMHRVIHISDRYFGIVTFSAEHQALDHQLVRRDSMVAVKLIDGLKGEELIAYGQMLKALEDWAKNDYEGDFPIEQDQDIYTQYRKIVAPPDEAFEQQGQSISDDNLVAHVESLSKSAALRFVDPLSKHELTILVEAWSLENSGDETVMRSLVKGHILRRES